MIMCPCGIVYIVKCSLRAESPRDFADMLLSWKHMPNVVIYDFARGLATHTNLREPEQLPFRPFEGRLMEPTGENIKLAQNGSVKVSLPWLDTRLPLHENCGQPVTGSSEHYVLYDRFHEKKHKRQERCPKNTKSGSSAVWKAQQSSCRKVVCKNEKKQLLHEYGFAVNSYVPYGESRPSPQHQPK